MKTFKQLIKEKLNEGADRYPADEMTLKELKIACYAAQNILDRLESGASIQRWQISAIVKAKEELASVYTSMSADDDEEMWDDEWEDEEPFYVGFEYPSMYGEEAELSEDSTRVSIPKSRYETIAKMHGASGPTHGRVVSSPKGTMKYKGARHLDFDKKTETHIEQTYSHGDHGLATIEKHTHKPTGEVKYFMYKKKANEETDLTEIQKSWGSSKGPSVKTKKGTFGAFSTSHNPQRYDVRMTHDENGKKLSAKEGRNKYAAFNVGFHGDAKKHLEGLAKKHESVNTEAIVINEEKLERNKNTVGAHHLERDSGEHKMFTRYYGSLKRREHTVTDKDDNVLGQGLSAASAMAKAKLKKPHRDALMHDDNQIIKVHNTAGSHNVGTQVSTPGKGRWFKDHEEAMAHAKTLPGKIRYADKNGHID